MALNGSGLGFTFSAEDKGMLEAQRELVKGLFEIEKGLSAIEALSQNAAKGGIASPDMTRQLDALHQTFETLGQTVGQQLPTDFATMADQAMASGDIVTDSTASMTLGFIKFARGAGKLVMNVFTGIGKVAKTGLGLAKSSAVGLFSTIQSGAMHAMDVASEIVGRVGFLMTDGLSNATNSAAQALSNPLEEKMLGLSKDARKFGANLGLTGKELSSFTSKAAGMAHALDISTDAAGKAIAAFGKTEKEFALVGIKSASDLAKFAEVTGVDVSELARTLRQAKHEFGLSDEATKRLVGSFQAFGKESGDIGGALKELPDIMNSMRKRAAQMGLELNKADLEKFGTQTAALAAGLTRVTKDSKKAMEIAKGLGEGMIESRQNFGKMFAGIEEDLPGFNKSIAIAFGDVQFSLDSMKKGPADFVTEMAKMVRQAKKSGRLTNASFDFMAKHLEAAVGEDKAAELVSFFRNADDAALDLISTVQKTPADFQALAKAGGPVRSLSEQFDRMRQQFVVGFRSIAKKEAVDFVRGSGAAFAKLGAQLKELAADKGPLGAIIYKFSEIHNLGAMALIPKTLRPLAAAFGTAVDAMRPAITAMHELGFSIKDLLSFRGLFVTGFLYAGAQLFATWLESGKDLGKTFQAFGKKLEVVAETAISYLEKLPDALDNVDQFLTSMFDGFDKNVNSSGGRWSRLWERFLTAAGKALTSLGGMFKKLAGGIWDGLMDQFDPNKEGQGGVARLGAAIGSGIRAAWGYVSKFLTTTVWPAIKDTVVGIFDGVVGYIDPTKDNTGAYSVGLAIGNAVSYAIDYVIDSLPVVWDAISRFGGALWDGLTGEVSDPDTLSTTAEKIGAAIGIALNSAIEWGVKRFEDLIQSNPKAAALIAFAAGGGGLVGGIAGLSVFLTGAGMNALGMVTENQFEYLSQQLTESVYQAGFAVGTTFDEAAKGGLEAAMKGANKITGQEFVDNIMRKDYMDAIHGAVERESKFILTASNDVDKRWREQGLKQLTQYTTHVDEVVSAMSSTFKISNEAAMDMFMNTLRTGGNVNDLLKPVIEKGFLKDLQVQFKYTADEQAKMLDSAKQKWNELKTGASDAVAGIADKATQTYSGLKDKAASAGNWLKSHLGLGGGAKVGVTTEETFIQKSKVDQKTLKGDMDTIRKATASVAQNLDAPVRKAVETVLETAFEKAYQNINAGTKKFATSQAEILGKMAKDLQSQVTSIWEGILETTSKGITAIQKDAYAALPMLKQMKSVMEDAKSAGDGIPELPDQSKRDKTLAEGQTLMIQAIDWPAWYTEEYREWAFAMKNALELIALAQTANAGPGGGKGSSQALLDELKKGKGAKGGSFPNQSVKVNSGGTK